jgi:hypothetical protein
VDGDGMPPLSPSMDIEPTDNGGAGAGLAADTGAAGTGAIEPPDCGAVEAATGAAAAGPVGYSPAVNSGP